MPTAADIAEEIAEAGTGPQSVTVAGQTVVDRSVDEKIKAHDHVASQEAAASNRPGLGLRFQQITSVYR